MKRTTLLLVAVLITYTLSSVQAQPAAKIDNFTLTDVVAKRSVSLSDYKSAKGVVLIFISNSCPYAKLYDQRILQMAKEYQAKGIQFLLINSNAPSDDTQETAEHMASFAQKKGYIFPYLADKDHHVATMFGATKNPEVFVLQHNADVFTIKYRGAIDDNPQMPDDVSAHYLKEAIQAVLTKGNLSVVDRRPTGCMIKKD